MGDVTTEGNLVEAIDDNNIDITDQEIEQLLEKAELNLKQIHHTAQTEKSATRFPQLHSTSTPKPYISTTQGVARTDPSRLVDDRQRMLSGTLRVVEDPILQKQEKNQKATAGSDWFNLPKAKMTPEISRDLQLLRMRSVLDPKRHYKKTDAKAKGPEFFQIGTIIEGPTEFYSARLQHRDRKEHIVDEVMSHELSTGRFRNKYNDIQALKSSGKRAHYQKLKEMRSRKLRK